MGIMLNPKIQEFGRFLRWIGRYTTAAMLSCNLFPIPSVNLKQFVMVQFYFWACRIWKLITFKPISMVWTLSSLRVLCFAIWSIIYMEEIEWYAIISYNFSFNYSQKGCSEFNWWAYYSWYLLYQIICTTMPFKIDHLKLQTKNAPFIISPKMVSCISFFNIRSVPPHSVWNSNPINKQFTYYHAI
jgi:hypothetical protein